MPYLQRILVKTILALSCIACCLVLTGIESPAENVSARLSQSDPTSMTLEINLNRPAPSSFIALLYLPARLPVVSTSPTAAKIDQKGGTVKWLLKTGRGQQFFLHIVTGRPVDPASVSAIIRYRRPGDGKFIEVQAAH